VKIRSLAFTFNSSIQLFSTTSNQFQIFRPQQFKYLKKYNKARSALSLFRKIVVEGQT
jgi:hypothetical protein